jgi:hypothetical protein
VVTGGLEMIIYFGLKVISEEVNNTKKNTGYSQKTSAAGKKQRYFYAQRTAADLSSYNIDYHGLCREA